MVAQTWHLTPMPQPPVPSHTSDRTLLRHYSVSHIEDNTLLATLLLYEMRRHPTLMRVSGARFHSTSPSNTNTTMLDPVSPSEHMGKDSAPPLRIRRHCGEFGFEPNFTGETLSTLRLRFCHIEVNSFSCRKSYSCRRIRSQLFPECT
jgi:hypothetical protein